MSRSKRLLIVNPGWEQNDLIKRAHEAGYALYGLVYVKESSFTNGFEDWQSIQGRDFAAALDWACRWNIDYVVSTQCDYGLQLQAYIAENLGLPSPGWRQAQLSANKWVQRQAFDATCGVKQPVFYLCYGIADAHKAAASLDFHVIVKPIDNRGSIGVSCVERSDELEDAVWHAIANSLSGLFLVEQRIQGTLLLVDGVGPRGLVVGQKTMNISYPYMNEDILFGGPSANDLYAQVADAHKVVCEMLGYKIGLTSGEYIVDEQGQVWLIEVTNRAGGVWIGSKVTAAIQGFDGSARLLEDFAGGATKHTEAIGPWVFLKYICLRPGLLQSLTGDEQWAHHPQYLAHYLWQLVPAEVLPITDAIKRSGILLTWGEYPRQAKDASNELIGRLETHYV